MRTEPAAGLSAVLDPSLWLAWFAELDRTFVFLLVLPLVVAAVGLWAHFRESEQERDKEGEHDGPVRAASNRAEAVGGRSEVREG